MKILNWIFLTATLATGLTTTHGQSSMESEVPGDNFSLEGALELFKKSSSPEEFERILNTSDSKVNNLDLNNDGNIDYIKVIDRNEGNVHAFTLQAVISQTESQDVAVIELEKLQDGKAVLQITGDSDVYGIETIIEPSEEVRVNAGASTARTVVNVWTWPSVQYVYGPSYNNPWISPWTYAYYPMWWRPWRPVAFYVYNPWWRPYRPNYSFCYSHRIGYLPRLYSPYRSTSVYVCNNYRNQITNYRSRYDGSSRNDGRNRNHYSRYDGYGGRTRSDYNDRDNDGRGSRNQYYDRNGRTNDQNDNMNRSRTPSQRNSNDSRGRYDATSSGSRNQYNTNGKNNDQSDYTNRSRTPSERNSNQSGSDFRRSPRSSGQNSSNSGYGQRSTTTRKSSNDVVHQQRQSSAPRISMNSQQRSSPSIQRSSSGSTPRQSGGGGGHSSGGGGSHSGGGHSRGRH